MKHNFVTHDPKHFECTICKQTWPYRPYSKCPGIVLVPHHLFKNSDNQQECHICGQTWQNRPRSRCPRMRVYAQFDHEPLRTRFQLGYEGYEIADSRLPQPVGCYRSDGSYILLYDPTQAARKQSVPQHRVTTTHSEIFWPRDFIPALEAFFHLKRVHGEQGDWHVSQSQSELADMAYTFSRFTASEIEQHGAGALHLKIAPCLLYPTFNAFQISSQRPILIKSVLAAYEKQRAAQ